MDIEEQEKMQKRVAFYETFLGAWVENRMEMDKQILTLSSLAIGLLMIFWGHLDTVTEFVLWLIAGGLYVLAIFLVLLIFRSNSQYIEYIIREEDQSKEKVIEKSLQIMTIWAFYTFLIGVLFTCALAVEKSGFAIHKV